MKVAALVLFVAVAGLIMVGAVDAKRCGPSHCEKPVIAAAISTAQSEACGDKVALTYTSTCTQAIAIKNGGAYAYGDSTSAALAVA